MTNNQIIRVALYPRVSTEEQAAHGYSLELQEEALVRYANEHGYKIVGIYRDEGNSARKPVMKRKVMLCRALLPKPEIILLDEPTVGLDPIFRHQMWDLLRQLNEQGVGFLLTTHYLEEAQQLCKRVAFLNQGKVVKTGVPSEIVGQLGAFCVENPAGAALFQTQEEALNHLRENGGKLRDTNLEDVFFRLSGGAV